MIVWQECYSLMKEHSNINRGAQLLKLVEYHSEKENSFNPAACDYWLSYLGLSLEYNHNYSENGIHVVQAFALFSSDVQMILFFFFLNFIYGNQETTIICEGGVIITVCVCVYIHTILNSYLLSQIYTHWGKYMKKYCCNCLQWNFYCIVII